MSRQLCVQKKCFGHAAMMCQPVAVLTRRHPPRAASAHEPGSEVTDAALHRSCSHEAPASFALACEVQLWVVLPMRVFLPSPSQWRMTFDRAVGGASCDSHLHPSVRGGVQVNGNTWDKPAGLFRVFKTN